MSLSHQIQKETSWLALLDQVADSLLPAHSFRDNLPQTVELFNDNLGTDCAVLLEIIPQSGPDDQLLFSRLMKIPSGEKAEDCPLPRALAKARIEQKYFDAWLEELFTCSREDREGVHSELEKVNRGFSASGIHLQSLSDNRLSTSIVHILDLPFEHFYVFPLNVKERCWGVLFFTFSTPVAISEESFRSVGIFSRMLADALAQQHYDIRQVLEQDFFGQAQQHEANEEKIELADVSTRHYPESLLDQIITKTIPDKIFLVDIKRGEAIFSNTDTFLGYEIANEKDVLDIFVNIIHPEDIGIAAIEFIQKLRDARDSDVVSCEYRMQHKNGNWIWIQERAIVFKRFPDGVVHQYISVLQDTSKKHQAEQDMREQGALLQATLDTLPDIKLRITTGGRIITVHASPNEIQQLKIDVEACKEQGLKAFLPTYVAQGILVNTKKAISSNSLQTFEFFQSTEGRMNYLEARIAPVAEGEALVVLRDITILKEAERKLHEKNSKLDQKNRQLQKYIESNLQLENFAYIASHDLREPLRTIRTFAQYLDKNIGSTLEKDDRMHLDFVINAANRMNHLIEDLLKYSVVDANPASNESIILPDLLGGILKELQAVIVDSDATINIRDVPQQMYGSPSRLQQVFQNLLTNAIKFRKKDTAPIVTISGKETPTHWEFSIADNGIGIDPDFHEQIFIIFKKLHGYGTYKGTGIGLALVKLIINQHGGEIWVESALDQGTTFHFTILK